MFHPGNPSLSLSQNPAVWDFSPRKKQLEVVRVAAFWGVGPGQGKMLAGYLESGLSRGEGEGALQGSEGLVCGCIEVIRMPSSQPT